MNCTEGIVSKMATGNKVEIRNLEGRSQEGYTTWGCCWPRGNTEKESGFIAENEAGEEVPSQSRILAWWPDGTVKWSAHTADAKLLGKKGYVLSGRKPADLTDGIKIEETEAGWKADNGVLTCTVRKKGRFLLENLAYRGRQDNLCVDSVLLIEECEKSGYYGEKRESRQYESKIEEAELLEKGSLQVVFRFKGTHCNESEEKIPWHIFLKIGYGEEKLHFTYTFFYDGNQEKDRLKGIGLRIRKRMEGDVFNRHIKFAGDSGVFHEASVLLLGGKKFSWDVYEAQTAGKMLGEDCPEIEQIRENIALFPHWDAYELCQDSDSHFSITKRIGEDACCWLKCLDGERAGGVCSFGDESGSILMGIRDAWQKYPSGISLRGLSGEVCEAVAWIWSPKAESMDFAHYTNTGYSQVYYEGYPWNGADAFGIANTSEIEIAFCEKMVPADEELLTFCRQVNKPAQYVCTPEHYHDCQVFGYWSLPVKGTPIKEKIEKQLTDFTEFYMQEVEQRKWYGLFNYGDIMHTYDSYRHVWRYDMGGFAWDNTELVPDYWIWYMFLRTGREDIFSFAERMTRHISEVDIYHMGDFQGMGSRHNVRHWGCACKEVRIAMAGHYRFYYYLTGDYRLEEIFDEIAPAQETIKRHDPLGSFYDKAAMQYSTHARSGPDWSSLCSNWMTEWERKQNPEEKQKILTGIADIAEAPLRLCSGPDFEFNPDTFRLRYIGERTTGGSHLQICMGAAQTWTELAELLGQENWKEMLAEYGRFYFLSREEQLHQSRGLIGEKQYTLPMLACGIGAYAAKERKDEKLAETVWCFLLKKLLNPMENPSFAEKQLFGEGNREILTERRNISTNDVGQWCLNMMMCLELIPKELPETEEQALKMTGEKNRPGYRNDY